MKTLSNALLVLSLITGLTSFAQAATPRERFYCELTNVNRYMQYQFYGFINHRDKTINLQFLLNNEDGKNIGQGVVKKSYQEVNGNISISIARENLLNSTLAISKSLLSIPSQSVSGNFDGLALNCTLSTTSLVSKSLPQEEFANYDLPTRAQPSSEYKTWTSSDGKLRLDLTLIHDFVSHYGGHDTFNHGWSEIRVAFLGSVVDQAEDVPRYMSYLLYGSEKRILQATLTNAADVKDIIRIFKNTKSSLNLFHPYGVTSPVNLQIDCSSGDACIITAQN
jgi:hypothetical protein